MLLLGMHGEATVLAATAAADGWRVVDAVTGAPPDLVALVDGDGTAATVAAVRACTTARAAAPVVLLAARTGTPPVPGIDQVVTRPDTHAAARAILERWRPDDAVALDRIEAAMGAGALRGLLARLRDQLDAALVPDTSGDAMRRAHRLGGIAGMLGFAALGKAWLDVEAGVPDAAPVARIETRRALAAIARRLA